MAIAQVMAAKSCEETTSVYLLPTADNVSPKMHCHCRTTQLIKPTWRLLFMSCSLFQAVNNRSMDAQELTCAADSGKVLASVR